MNSLIAFLAAYGALNLAFAAYTGTVYLVDKAIAYLHTRQLKN